MFVIGERINGMFKEVKKAVQERDKGVIQDLALRQLKAGANALDVNVGPTKGKPIDNMGWLIETIQEVTDAPICVDTPKFDVMSEAIRTCTNPAIINSSKASTADLDRFVPLTQEGTDASTMASSRTADLEAALAALPPRDAKVLRLYFGLDDGNSRTLEEIGRMMGVTRERIRQLRDRALRQLKEEHGDKLRELAA